MEQFDFKGIDFRASKNGRRRDECMVHNERNIAAQTRIQVARERKVQRRCNDRIVLSTRFATQRLVSVRVGHYRFPIQ
jgi:hypothetical protein